MSTDTQALKLGGPPFFVDPRLTGLEADLFWLPQAYRRVLTAIVTSRPRAFETSRFSLGDLRCRKALLIGADGTQHLLLRRQGQVLQLLCLGDSVASRNCGLALLANELPNVEGKVRLMRRFAEITRRRHREPSFPWFAQTLSLRNALIALDGRLTGASYRDIAEVIFGSERVRRDWEGGQGWMRSRIARAARRGWHLAQGGYRALLA